MDNFGLLDNIFNNINRWLEFSERKNAYIFSFFSLIVVFSPFIGRVTDINLLIKVSICIFYLLYIITTIFVFLSLFPKTQISKNLTETGRNQKITDSDNLIFYGDISKYSVEEYKKAIIKKYKIQDISNGYFDDIITQIIINSNIVRKKMLYFKISVISTCLAIIQFNIFFSISLFI